MRSAWFPKIQKNTNGLWNPMSIYIWSYIMYIFPLKHKFYIYFIKKWMSPSVHTRTYIKWLTLQNFIIILDYLLLFLSCPVYLWAIPDECPFVSWDVPLNSYRPPLVFVNSKIIYIFMYNIKKKCYFWINKIVKIKVPYACIDH